MTVLLGTRETARRLGTSVSHLAKLRVAGGGPPFVKHGAKVLYRETDLEAWIADLPHYFSTAELRQPGPLLGVRDPNERSAGPEGRPPVAPADRRDQGPVLGRRRRHARAREV